MLTSSNLIFTRSWLIIKAMQQTSNWLKHLSFTFFYAHDRKFPESLVSLTITKILAVKHLLGYA